MYSKDDEKNVILSIGSSSSNFKIIELYTNLLVYPNIVNKIKIPKVIIQTNNQLSKNIKHDNSILSILENNPDYEYIFFDDSNARQFIKDNFLSNIIDEVIEKSELNDILLAYDYIIPPPIKADLFRYSYLYINGGFYLDSKIICYSSLNNLVKEEDNFFLCKDDAKNSYYNGIIGITPNNNLMLLMLKNCVKNILNKNYLNDIHEPTGNKLLYKYFSKEKCSLDKKGGCYFDNKYIPRKSLSYIINENDKNVYCYDINDNLMFNSIIISIPSEKYLKNLIDNIIKNVNNILIIISSFI